MLKNVNYNKFAKDFDSTRYKPWDEFKFFNENLEKGDIILDAGSGNGRLLNFLKDKNIKYFGLDISKKLIEISKKKYPNNNFIIGNIKKLPFENIFFDKIYSIASLHHLNNYNNRQKALNEFFRVLKPNGFLNMTVWNLDNIEHQENSKFKEKILECRKKAKNKASFLPFLSERDLIIPWGKEKIKRYYYAYKKEELEEQLKIAGFTDIDIFGVKDNKKIDLKHSNNICVIAKKPKKIELGFLKFDLIDESSCIKKMNAMINTNKTNFITTVNPEIYLKAIKNENYKNILIKSDLITVDGWGIVWALNYFYKKNRIFWLFDLMKFIFNKRSRFFSETIKGSSVFKNFCLQSNAKIFLLGGEEITNKKTKEFFTKKCINIVGNNSANINKNNDDEIINEINNSKAEIVFVAFGAPKQERWIIENMKKTPLVKIFMGVGGSFDFIAGKIDRAPVFIQKIGFEWLWRLIKEPKRIKRILNAIFIFPREFTKTILKK